MSKVSLTKFSALVVAGAVCNIACDANEKDEYSKEKSVKQEDSAEKPQIIVSGAATVHANFGNPDYTYYKGNPEGYEKVDKDTSATRIGADDANIDVKAVGKLSNGTKYMADIDIDVIKGSSGVSKMYLSFSRDGWGTLQIGNVKGPDAKCMYGGQQLLGGSAGLDGNISGDFDPATGVISPLYNVAYTNKATKIVYYSPTVSGFQIAGAITPDTKHHGDSARDRHAGDSSNGNDGGIFNKGKGDERPSGRNNIALALAHSYEFQNGITTKLSGVYIFEDTKAVKVKSFKKRYDTEGGGNVEWDDLGEKKIKLHNAHAYYLSATVGYKQWKIGVGFLDNGKSRTPKEAIDEKIVGEGDGSATQGVVAGKTEERYIGNFLGTKNSNAGKAWNIGAEYCLNDNWTFSGVFHHMKRKVDSGSNTKGSAVTLAADYKICDGLKVFCEYDHVWTKSCDTACDRYNRIYKDASDRNAIMKQTSDLFIVGAKVSF